MKKENIFVVEDEQNIRQLIEYNLKSAGYNVFLFEDGESLLKDSNIKKADMFILDIMLPGIDGFELCKKIKEKKSLKNIPLIMLTAKGEEINKVIGLEIGADDYITKPFSVREFTARVKALFRRANAKDEDESDILEYKDIVLDIKRYEAKKDGKTIELTHKEFELLRMLIKNAGQVLTRELMLEKVWGFDYFGETRTVDVHIRFLRKKLENEDENLQYIETVRGVGYRLKDK